MPGKTTGRTLVERFRAEHQKRMDGMSDKAKATLEAALAAISEIKGEMDEASADALMSGLQKALEPGQMSEEEREERERDEAEREREETERKEREEQERRERAEADKELPPKVAEELRTLRERADTSDGEVKRLRSQLDERDRLDRERGWIERASELVAIPGDIEKVGKQLAAISELKPDLANNMLETLRAANAVSSEGGMFAEHGTSHDFGGTGSAMGKIMEMARERVRSEAGKVTMAQAIRQIRRENKALARQVAEERR